MSSSQRTLTTGDVRRSHIFLSHTSTWPPSQQITATPSEGAHPLPSQSLQPHSHPAWMCQLCCVMFTPQLRTTDTTHNISTLCTPTTEPGRERSSPEMLEPAPISLTLPDTKVT